MTYPPGALAVLRSNDPTGRRTRQNICDEEPGPDPHTPAQRAAIERKRSIVEARDQARFLWETALMADEEFAVLPEDDHHR